MDLTIKYNYSNISFNSRLPKAEKIKMDKVLSGLLKKDDIDLSGIIYESGFTNNYIYGWFKCKFGFSPKEYFALREEQKLDKEFLDLYNKGYTVNQFKEHFSKPQKWVKAMLVKHGLVSNDILLKESSEKMVLQLLNKGGTYKTISKKSNLSVNQVKKIIRDNTDENALQYRKHKDVKLNYETKLTRKKSIIKKCFSMGKGIKETAKLAGVSRNSIFRVKEEFNMQTALDRAHELMDTFLPDMVQAKDSLTTMSRFFGLSKETVARRIKELYGKNYYDIKYKE